MSKEPKKITWLVKKNNKVVCKVKSSNKVEAVILAWEKVNNIANLKDLLKKFGSMTTFLFCELKLGSAGYYLDIAGPKEAA